MPEGVCFQDVLSAHKRIQCHIHRTPFFTSATIDSLTGRNIFFKAEHLQKTGSFKARGALNSVLSLKEKDPSTPGVVTHSSGNHGQALAWAARLAGLKCSVVVPKNAPTVKADAIKGYGADLTFCEPNPTSRAETCAKISQETGRVIIPPYDYYDVIAGQGTIAVEFLEQVPQLDAILVPISGGGMSSGIAIAAKAIKPTIKIFLVEPQGKGLEKCLKAKQRLWNDPPKFLDTIADGMRIQQAGQLTFPILCELAEEKVFTVTDEEMITALKFVMSRMKQVVETCAATGVAAVMSEEMRSMDPSLRNIGVILCGGNIDIDKLPW